MKILSIAIPCYNSAEYMSKCVESLLKGGEDVEIIIVNDGSFKDNTAEIADEYAAKYPTIIKAVHQENGGHGEAVNTGLKNATGLFFKVVDSDDWVDETAYIKVIKALKYMHKENRGLDMLLTNFVYEKQGAKTHTMRYTAVPRGKMISWDSEDMRFSITQYILMHSVIYRTELLRECGLKLPKHTFYVDNIFVYHPLPYVKNIYYLNVDFYRYFIGREDQSVNEKVMVGRVDQQIRVTKLMLDSYRSAEIKSDKLNKYMLRYMAMMMCISSVLLLLDGSKEALEKKAELWDYLKKTDENVYKKVMRSPLGWGMNVPGKLGRKFSIGCYRIAQKLFKFN